MRITLLLAVIFTVFLTLGWTFFSGLALILFFLLLVAVTCAFLLATDKILLFLLGAREIKLDYVHGQTHRVNQIAYKLGIRPPKLYFYNGVLDRTFILQTRDRLSLVYSKNLLTICDEDEIEAISFQLLLQAKHKLAKKRTKTLGLLGVISWLSQGVVDSIKRIFPSKRVGEVLNWLIYYMIHPWINLAYKLLFGQGSLKKIHQSIAQYDREVELIKNVKNKIRYPDELYSLPMKKFIELTLINKNAHYQNILALEFLPHEWDIQK